MDISESEKNICSPELVFSNTTENMYLLVTGNGNNCSYYGNKNDERNVMVYKLNSSEWNLMDMTVISTILKARAISFDSDSLGNLYVAVVDVSADSDEVSVWKNDGTVWTNITNASNISINGNVNDVNLEIDSSDIPWISVKSKESGYDYITIYKFDGVSMTKVGENVFVEENGISLKNKSRISFKLNSSDIPYISFVERVGLTGYSFLSIKRYLDNKWVNVGATRLYRQDFSTNNNFDFLDDSLYVTYRNEYGNISIVNYSQKDVEIGNWWQPKGYEHLS